MEKKGNKTHFWKGKNLIASWARLSTRLKKVKKKNKTKYLSRHDQTRTIILWTQHERA